jgi:hypothetical protein
MEVIVALVTLGGVVAGWSSTQFDGGALGAVLAPADGAPSTTSAPPANAVTMTCPRRGNRLASDRRP